jgi:hypothetical protein
MKNNRVFKFRAWTGDYFEFDSPTIRVLERFDHENCTQFTGVQDVNNVDIYEGDLVEYDGTTCVVRFQDCGFFVCVFENENFRSNLNDVTDVIKVVGNVYENQKSNN